MAFAGVILTPPKDWARNIWMFLPDRELEGWREQRHSGILIASGAKLIITRGAVFNYAEVEIAQKMAWI